MRSTTTEPEAAPAPSPGPGAALPVNAACCTPSSHVSDDAATGPARMFEGSGDAARVKIMSMLLNVDEACACDFSTSIEKTAATTSHHLELLRVAGLVATEKRGTWDYYRVVRERLAAVRDALAVTG